MVVVWGRALWMEISPGRVFTVMYVCVIHMETCLYVDASHCKKGIPVSGGTARLSFLAKCQPNIVTPKGSESRQAPMNRFGVEMTWISCRQHRPLTFHPALIEFTWVHERLKRLKCSSKQDYICICSFWNQWANTTLFYLSLHAHVPFLHMRIFLKREEKM